MGLEEQARHKAYLNAAIDIAKEGARGGNMNPTVLARTIQETYDKIAEIGDAIENK